MYERIFEQSVDHTQYETDTNGTWYAAISEIGEEPEVWPGTAAAAEHDPQGCGCCQEEEEALVPALEESLAGLAQNANPLAAVLEAVNFVEGRDLAGLRPAELYHSLVVGDEQTRDLGRVFEVIAYPGEVVDEALRGGDLLLRRGAGGETFVSVLADGELRTAAELAAAGAALESFRSGGRYAAVVEGGSFPHMAGEGYYRRVTDADDLLSRGQLLVRPLEGENGGEWTDAETIPSAGLRWAGATPAQLAFMRRVYDAHVARSSQRRRFQPDVPAADLGPIENGQQARTAAARACRAMLTAARAAIAVDPALSRRVSNIGITSGYRSATRQFGIWQRNFPRYYRETSAERARQTGGEHGAAAVTLLARYIGRRVGAPGFSLHNDGRAVDLTTTENGRRLAAGTAADNIRRWRASWFFGWLSANAGRFNFHQNAAIDEPWHWEFRAPAAGAAPGGTGGRAAVAAPGGVGGRAAVDWCAMRRTIAASALRELGRWRGRSASGGTVILTEGLASQLPILEEYWRATPQFGTAAAARAQAAVSAADANGGAWSAAFISFVMRSAGILSAHGFDFSSLHMTYIVGALRNRERSDRNRAFWLADQVEMQHEATAELGDLFCFNRTVNGRLTTHSYDSLRRDFWLGGNQARRPRGSSHTSIVTGFTTINGVRHVEVIGGNEGPDPPRQSGSVRVRRFALNASGGIENPAAHRMFGIIKITGC